MENLSSHWSVFHEILYSSMFRKSVEEMQVSLKSDKNNGYFISSTSMIRRSILLRMRNILDKSCRESENTFCSVTASENCAVYEIMWKNMVEPDRPQMTIQYGACPSHAGYLRLQTQTQNITTFSSIVVIVIIIMSSEGLRVVPVP